MEAYSKRIEELASLPDNDRQGILFALDALLRDMLKLDWLISEDQKNLLYCQVNSRRTKKTFDHHLAP